MNEEEIYNLLMRQSFDDWYKGDFNSYIMGEKDAPSKEEIIEDIRDFFQLKTNEQK